MTVEQIHRDAENDTIERRRYLEVLHRFTMSQAELTDLDDICWYIAKTAIGDLGFEDCVVYLLNEGGDTLIQRAAHGPKNPERREILDPIEIPIGEGIVGSVAKTGRYEVIHDARDDQRYITDDQFRCSELAVPIVCNKRVIGVLDSEHEAVGFYSDEDIQLFTTIAALAATRIDTALALERLELQAVALQEAREAANAASAAKSQFLAAMSHDMRTPLTAIIGFAELLDSADVDDRQRADWSRRIVKNSEYMKEMVGNVLDMAAIESGQVQVKVTPFNPHEWLSDTLDLVAPRARDKGLVLRSTVDDQLPPVIEADASKLREILINLLSNAIKYTEAGEVHLSARFESSDSGDLLALVVEDTGLGIEAESLQQVFEPFTRVHDVEQFSTIEGTGLGLTVVKSFADAMGGKVDVESTVGKGSRFTLRIPCRAAHDRVADESGGSAIASENSVLRGRRLLVCEDSETVQALIGFVLERAGATVETALNGGEGLHKFLAAKQSSRPFDAVITDMQMPVMTGYELAASIRQHDQMPILALTAYAQEEDEKRCLAAGCTAYQTKPIDTETFAITVTRLFSGDTAS